MTTIPWTNTTSKHPGGVCEAATSIWLQTIADNGIQQANKITATACDDLQTACESGAYTWAIDLLPLLSADPNASFDAFDGPTIVNNGQMLNVLNTLTDNNFRFISATNGNGSGHATALYQNNGTIYFFDPNNAIYSISSLQSDKVALANQIMTNLQSWSDIVVRSGRL
ncbi:MAG TPA: YopT-type cysteine protease domain-containing protein [Flavobacterium sp.]|nr:YopT-type cysteine protease domain-containing protein [Flavobacterium sp.]